MIHSSSGRRGFVFGDRARPVSKAVAGRFGVWRRHLSCRLPAFREEFRQSTQVNRRHGEGEYQFSALKSAQLQLPKSAVLLAVAENSFDQFPSDLTDGVAGMASGALIDRAGAVVGVLGHMRGDPDGAAISNEVSRVITFVGAYRLTGARL